MSRISSFVTGLAVLIGGWAAVAAAADATWTASVGGSWSNGALWSTGVAPGSTATTNSADVATLGASIAGSTRVDVTIDANRNVGGIVFNGTNKSLRFVGGQAVLLSAGGFLRAEDSVTAETAAIRLQGSGTSFTLTSDTTAAAGLTVGSLVGLSESGSVTTVVLTGTGRGLAGNPNDSAGQLQDGPNGGRLRVVKQGSGTWQIKLNNPWSGGLEVIEGEADVRGTNNPATNAILLGGTSGTASATLFYGNTSDIYEPITVRAGSSGTLLLRNDSGSTRRIRATTTLERDVTVEISSPTGSTAFQGNFAGEGDVTKTGAGTMSMSGGTATQHAGSFIVSAGTLVTDNVNSTNVRNRIAVAAGAKFDAKQGSPIAGLDGAGEVDYSNNTNKTLRLGGSGSYEFSGALLNTGPNALALTADLKEGGVQSLSGSSSHRGTTTVRSGTLALAYATTNSSKLADDQILYLHGGRLELRGGSHVEVVGSTTVNGGFSRLARVGGSATIALGALTASGGGLDIESAGIATTTTTTNAGGLLAGSGRVTIGGSDWAVADAEGGIIPFTSYVTLAAGTAGNNSTHYSLTGGAAGWSGNLAVRTLKITPTGPGQALDLGAGSLSVATTRSNGGLLFTGSDAYAITAARIQAGGDDEVVLHHHGGGTLSLPALNHKLVQFGTGPTLLTAPATGAAGLILSGGTVRFSDNAQLGTVTGTGVVVLWGGRLVADTSGGDVSLVNASAGGHRTVALGAADATIDVVGGGTLTVAGVISTTSSNNVGGDTPLVIGGPGSSGTVVLSGTNTFTGDTRLHGGTLSISADANLGNAAFWIDVAESATLATTSSLSSSRVVSLRADAEGRFAPAADTTLTLAGRVRGPGSLRTAGPGVLLLSGANSFTGGTTLAAGVLELGSTTALGSTGTISFAGGTLRYGINNATDYSDRFATSGQPVAIDTGGRDVAFATGFGGAGGSLLKAGSGTLTLAADNAHTGTTTISGGTLKVGAGGTAGSLGATAAVAIASGGRLTFDRSDAYGGPVAAAISGAGGVTVAGGTLTLSGDSSFTGGTSVAAGTLRAATTTSLGLGNAADAVSLAGGRLELAADSGGAYGNGFGSGLGTTITGDATIASDRLTAGAGVVQQLGGLAMGGQTLTIARGANVTSGTATVAFGGEATFSADPTVVTQAGAELRFDGGITGVLSTLTKNGPGTLTISGSGHAGGYTINAGTFVLNDQTAVGGGGGTIALAGGVTLDNTSGSAVNLNTSKPITLGSTLAFTGTNSLGMGTGITTLTANTTIDVAAGTLTFGGDVVGNAFGLTKAGLGVLELAGLTGTASYTGNTAISAGELYLTGSSQFGTGTAITVADGAFLRVGSSASVSNVTVTSRPSGLILESLVNGDIVYAESGTLTTSNANMNGTQTIDSGVELAAAGDFLGSIPASATAGRIVMRNDAALRTTTTYTLSDRKGIDLESGTARFISDSGASLIIPGVVSGSGGLVKSGPGGFRLTGENTFTGGSAVQEGTLGIDSDAALGAVSGRLLLDGGTVVAAQNTTLVTIDPARSVVMANGKTSGMDATTGGTLVYAGVLGEEDAQGTAAGLRIGSFPQRQGTVRLAAANTFRGATAITAGTLEVAVLADGGTASGLGQSSADAANLSLSNGATLRYTGTTGSTDRLFSLGIGGGRIDAGSGTLALTGSGVIATTGTGGRSLTLAGGGSGSFAAGLTDDASANATSLVKEGAGTWTLTGANTYTGSTTISSGTLRVGTGGTAGTLGATAAVTIASGGHLAFDRSDAYGGPVAAAISGAGGVSVAGGTLTLSGDSSFTGGTTVAAGTLRAAGSGSLGLGNVAVAAGGTLEALATPALGPGAAIDVAAGGRLVVADGVSLPLAAAASLADWRTLPSPTARQTVARILDGTAPAGGTNLTAAWLAAAPGQFSDILSLSGTGAGNRFVLSLSLDPLLSAQDLSTLTIGRRAGSGDEFTAIGTTLMGLDQPWTSGFTTLGQYGIDTQTDTIWVVADANSQFVVMAVPEPELLPPLAAGLALAAAAQAVSRRRRGAAR